MTATARRVTPPAGTARLLAGVGGAPTLRGHLATFGPLEHPPKLVEEIEAAALYGRGGAGFPTASKLEVVATARGRPVVVANAVEGEPASRKDRTLLRVAPHLVLDGAELAAFAVGAETVLIGAARDAPELVAAIGERRGPLRFELRRVASGFVAGEETALLRSLERKPAKPTTKPPYPFQRGLRGAPTLVQNVETLAHVGLIARFGAGWFGRGTALVTLGGGVARPGVHEIPLGATLGDALRACGGTTGNVQAFLVGGYFGRWVLPADADRLELSPEVLGAGAIVALPSATCAAAECARVVRYLASESAGQCGPCVHGLPAIAAALDVHARGDNRSEAHRLARLVSGRGACRHPDGVARFVESALAVFADDLARHARRRGCGRRCLGVLPVRQS
jgi:NADH:ubiquinone oxidoreductase subunit F (NADH-binding)